MSNFFRSRAAHAFAIAVGMLAFSHVASAQLPVLEREQRLRLPPDTAPQAPEELPVQFGRKVFTDGQTTIVTVDRGRAAYAYVKNRHGRWVYQADLPAPDGAFTAKRAAILGDTALVQAYTSATSSQNVVLVFHRSGGVWTNTQTIPGGSLPLVSDENIFAIGSDFIALGDPSFNSSRGAVHIYNAVGAGTYVFGTSLQVADAVEGYLLGYNPGIQGNRLAVVSPGAQTVFVFERTGGVWSQQASLGYPEIYARVAFAFNGNRLVLTKDQRSVEDLGNPTVYVRNNGVWTLEQELVHPYDPQGRLGEIIALDGRRMIVASGWVDEFVPDDKVFLYERNGSTWTATAELRGAKPVTCIERDPNNGTRGAAAISGRTAFWACPTTPTQNEEFEGSVHVYRLPALD